MATVQKVQTTLSDKLASLPAKPGCYIYKNDKGEVLYVGKAVNLHNRVRSYFQKGAQLHPRTQRLVASVRDMEWIITDTEVEALILECTLIKKYRPFYNIRLRDDKSYPYVCVTTSEIYPRVFFTRRPHLKPDGNRYFGPYTDVRAVRDTLRTVRRIFGVQSCTHRFTGAEKMRPCLYYHLGQCLGPCTGELPPEEYRKAVDQVMMLFEGRQDEILERMNKSMEEAAENLQFERAAAMRDRIKAIQRLAQRQKVFTVEQVDQDIVGIALEGGDAVAHVFFIRAGRLVGRDNFVLDSGDDESPAEILSQFLKQYYEGAAAIPSEILLPEEPADREAILTWLGEKRGKPVRLSVPQRGEKKRLVSMVVENAQTSLEQLKKRGATGRSRSENAVLELGDALDMEVPPVRIECFDISNLQGGYTVASMTVFENGTPAKSQYRHFRIKTVEGQDDFASMREVIGRRLARAKQGDERFSDRPDLMIIDGGKGQLSAALEAVHAAEEEGLTVVSLAKREEEIFVPDRPLPIRLDKRSQALHLVQHIRDEAHRFAITYHRRLRGKGSLKSELDNVPGIGQVRRRELIKHFGSVAQLRDATLEDIAAAPSMNATAAQRLYEHLHGEDIEHKPEPIPS